MSKEFKPQVYYLARRKWFDQLSVKCDELVKQKGKDPVAIFWKSFAIGMTGNINDSLRLLESFQSRKDMQYPVTLARLYFHKKSSSIDHEAIDSLESEKSVAEDVAKEAGLVLAARFCLYTDDSYQARVITEKLLENYSSNGGNAPTAFELEAIAIQQWCTLSDIENNEDKKLSPENRKRIQAIDGVYRGKSGSEMHEVDSLMVWAKSRLMVGSHNEVLNILNQLIAMYPWFQQALADKTLLLASSGEWDQSLDTAQRLLDMDAQNLDGLQVIAVHAFTQESQSHDAVQKFEEFETSVRTREPLSVDYAVEIATLFACICSRQPRALQICVRILERTLKNSNLTPAEEARIFCEIGHVQTMQGPMQFEKATKCFQDATQRDNSSADALEGMILCQLSEGLVEDAESQVELLLLMHNSEELGYKFLYLQSLFLRNKKDSKKAHIDALNACRESFLSPESNTSGHNGSAKAYMNCFNNFRSSNPDFLMLLATDYLSHSDSSGSSAFAPSSSTLTGNPNSIQGQLVNANTDTDSGLVEEQRPDNAAVEISAPVQCGLDLLNQVLRLCPGTVCAYVEIARCYCSLGMHEEASRALQQCLSLQPNCAPILLAMAKTEVSRSKVIAADRVLEQTLACDFSIRSVPLFKLIKSLVRSQQGRLDEALQEVEQLLALPEFGYSLANPSTSQPDSSSAGLFGGSYADSLRLTDDDRVGAFVTYASLLSKLRRMKEANKVLGHAKVMFAGSAQEVQVLVAASQLFVEKGDFDSAIRMLDKISDESPTYSRAQIIKADIILTNNHDKEGYTKCYQQLAEKEPSAKNFSLLGEAYLRILNPEAAIDALDRAYKLDPTNSRLRGRIGRTLVSTHEYHRAVEFYESSIREQVKVASRNGGPGGNNISTDVITLSHDLAKLYIKLGRAQNSIRVLNSILRENPSDLTAMRQDVTTLLILTKVQQFNTPVDTLNTFLRACALQKEVVLKLRSTVTGGLSSSHDVIEAERVILSTICEKIGQCHVGLDDPTQGEAYFNEAVQHNLHNVHAMTGLAKLYHARNDRDHCIQQCNKIITAVPTAEEAAVLLSEIQFQSAEPSAAITPLTNLLKLLPNNYVALEKVIILFRRAGKLDEATAFLKNAEKNDRRCTSHAGFHYCQGLYARYTNDVGKAISEFNLSRKDDLWGAQSLVHMIELYLNPDQEGAWEEREAGPLDEATRANIAAAEQLLTELKPKSKDPLRVKILENYCSLATRNKTGVDRAMQSLSEMLDRDQDYLPAVLGMATGFMIEKNQHKARNLLKRVGKMELSHHDGEDFEKANLLLAKFYIDKNKSDLAEEMCKKTLVENKSCSQAFEILGLVYEKESKYDRASEAYEKAWKLEFEASASVGFKLAFSYLKCRSFVQAIDVCELVLAQYPDYPRISEEILKKAQQGLRTTV